MTGLICKDRISGPRGNFRGSAPQTTSDSPEKSRNGNERSYSS